MGDSVVFDPNNFYHIANKPKKFIRIIFYVEFLGPKNKILFQKASNFSKPIARLEKGRLLVIKKCEKSWCKIKTENYSGWIKADNVWGAIK